MLINRILRQKSINPLINCYFRLIFNNNNNNKFDKFPKNDVIILDKNVNFLSKRIFSSSTGGDSSSSDSNVRTVTINKNKPKPQPNLSVVFVLEDGKEIIGKACHGDSLLDVVLNNELEIDGFGACEGTLACSTCHLILSEEDFNRLPNKITDEEMDMLDLAYGLTETSRLGCQIYMSKEFDGLKVKVPASVNDVRLR